MAEEKKIEFAGIAGSMSATVSAMLDLNKKIAAETGRSNPPSNAEDKAKYEEYMKAHPVYTGSTPSSATSGEKAAQSAASTPASAPVFNTGTSSTTTSSGQGKNVYHQEGGGTSIYPNEKSTPYSVTGKRPTGMDAPFDTNAPIYDSSVALSNMPPESQFSEEGKIRALSMASQYPWFSGGTHDKSAYGYTSSTAAPITEKVPIPGFSKLEDNEIVPLDSKDGITNILDIGSAAIPYEDAVMRQDLGLYTTSFPNQRDSSKGESANAADGSKRTYQNYYQNFNRYYNVYNELEMSGLKTYVFITRPDLYIFADDTDQCSMLAGNREGLNTVHGKTMIMYSGKFIYMNRFHNIILKQLTSAFSSHHHFIPFLFDRTLSLQLTDTNIREYSTKQLYTGYSYKYAGHGLESHSGSGEFTMQFREDNALRVTKLFTIWEDYIDGVTRGLYNPKREYIMYDELDYVCSVYEFVTAPDGMEILYWAKYTGCFPTNVNHSNFSHSVGVGTGLDNKVDINFAFSHFDALDPAIITDFNMNCPLVREFARSQQIIDINDSRFVLPHYDPNILTGRPLAGPPFVAFGKGGYAYYLLWAQTPETVSLFK